MGLQNISSEEYKVIFFRVYHYALENSARKADMHLYTTIFEESYGFKPFLMLWTSLLDFKKLRTHLRKYLIMSFNTNKVLMVVYKKYTPSIQNLLVFTSTSNDLELKHILFWLINSIHKLCNCETSFLCRILCKRKTFQSSNRCSEGNGTSIRCNIILKV